MPQFPINKNNSLFYIHYAPADAAGVTWIFFNALTGDTQMWEADIALRLRAEGHGTLSFNYRGQANTTFSADETLDSALIVNDVCKLLTELKPQRPVLCGLSIGGLFALQCWLSEVSDLETVSGLVLINTLRREGERLRWINDALVRCVEVGGLQLFRDLFVPLLFNEEWQAENRGKFLQQPDYVPLNGADGHYNLLKNAGSADWDQPYEKLTLPTLVVTGMQDHVFLDTDDVERLCSRLPDARHVKMADAGHMIPAERPAELVDALLAFVGEVLR